METEENKIDTAVVEGEIIPEVLPTQDKKFTDKGGRSERKKNPRKSSRKDTRVRSEFDQKMVSIRRVTRVVAGGRRFSFSVTIVAGNRKGMVGVGQGKAGDTPLAIEKALRDAKKNMIQVKTTPDMSIPHEVRAKYGASRVTIMPAKGRGLLAGSSVRTVLELAGLTGVNAKILSGTKNRANNAKVAIAALSKLARSRK